ncbi:MAG TPA: type II toxin-antitoxin system RelE/ParE family toxin [Pyrinomonadaceae bacterium]|nr:type II toxin-antitoxin system RelE/ParE family toxin [Pyrinomonadaceae bacterium]
MRPAALEDHPFAGRTVPEFDDKTIREVFVYNYRIVYQLESERVTFSAVTRQAAIYLVVSSESARVVQQNEQQIRRHRHRWRP